jgi:hypothetical protein
MYTYTNFLTKKQFKKAFASGSAVECYQPGDIGLGRTLNGEITIEGPHGGQHTWYARVLVENNMVTKVIA